MMEPDTLSELIADLVGFLEHQRLVGLDELDIPVALTMSSGRSGLRRGTLAPPSPADVSSPLGVAAMDRSATPRSKPGVSEDPRPASPRPDFRRPSPGAGPSSADQSPAGPRRGSPFAQATPPHGPSKPEAKRLGALLGPKKVPVIEGLRTPPSAAASNRDVAQQAERQEDPPPPTDADFFDEPGGDEPQGEAGVESEPADVTSQTPPEDVGTLSASAGLPISWEIVARQVRSCTLCPRHRGDTPPVMGAGPARSPIVIVGLEPGRLTDRQRGPFQGAGGALLDRILSTVLALRRDQVYLTTLLKCHAQDMAVRREDVASCWAHLIRELELVRPGIVIGLGEATVQALLNTDATLETLRGQWHPFGGVSLLPSHHPDEVLRDPSLKRAVFNDMKMVLKALQNGSAPTSSG